MGPRDTCHVYPEDGWCFLVIESSVFQINSFVGNPGCSNGLEPSCRWLILSEAFCVCPTMTCPLPLRIGTGTANAPQGWEQAGVLSQYGELWILLLWLQQLWRDIIKRIVLYPHFVFINDILSIYNLNCVRIDRNLIRFKYKGKNFTNLLVMN